MGKMNSNDDEELMNWSPESSTEEKLDTLSNTSSRTARSRLHPPSSRFSPDHRIKTQRSGSLSSENSLTSQSTITTGGGGNGGYARYGMAPMIYPSESTTSNSSRSHSRLSDYSASSSQASSNATSIPRASSRASSSIPSSNNNTASNHNVKHTSGLRRPSDHHIDRSFRSSSRIGGPIYTNNIPTTTSGSRLAKRATHVPLPSSRAAPKPQMVASSRSTGLSSTRLPSRASHIPSPRASAASPEPRSPTLSPRNNNSSSRPRSPFTNSRIGGIRSPTPTGGTPRNSIFSSSESRRQQDKDNSNHNNNSNNSNNSNNHNSRIGRPPSSAGNARQTGLRPPSAIGKVSTGSRRGHRREKKYIFLLLNLTYLSIHSSKIIHISIGSCVLISRFCFIILPAP
ncbi:hypothetical protein BDC45DRAFT_216178 [Circinella umbellata]|nr:hypothetical protein BDC45DRAFT_216178 [Circinella umbellata]